MLINLAGFVFAAGLMAFLLSYLCRRLESWNVAWFSLRPGNKWWLRLSGLVLMLGSGALFSYSLPKPMEYAKEPVDEWLFLMDEAFYDDAWSQSARALQTSLSEAEFMKLAEKRREPLGNVVTRVRTTAVELSALPDGREGTFKLHIYRTTFASGAQREEIVVMEAESNEWKILNYNLQPVSL